MRFISSFCEHNFPDLHLHKVEGIFFLSEKHFFVSHAAVFCQVSSFCRTGAAKAIQSAECTSCRARKARPTDCSVTV